MQERHNPQHHRNNNREGRVLDRRGACCVVLRTNARAGSTNTHITCFPAYDARPDAAMW
ncbi:unnamed protein product [Ectocarpus sp. CCAP 1310/34]|nr:unnamed protein product [Ectocarpus sp. CCAP 1310/34]